MNKGRGKDHIWQFVKYKFDTAIYAQCSCGFHYACCTTKTVIPMRVEPNINGLYKYCPYCGSRKTKYIDDVKDINKFPWDI